MASDAYFDITRGQGQPLPRKDAAIVCKELPGTMEATIEEARSAVMPVLQKLSVGVDTWTVLGERLGAGADAWTRLGMNLGESRQQLDQLIRRLDALAADLEQGKGTAGKLLTDPALADTLTTILDKGDTSMDQVQGILKGVQLAGARLSTVSEALATETNDLPGLVLQTQQTVYKLERLIEGIQRHWLIRSYVEPRQPNTRIPPSEVVP